MQSVATACREGLPAEISLSQHRAHFYWVRVSLVLQLIAVMLCSWNQRPLLLLILIHFGLGHAGEPSQKLLGSESRQQKSHNRLGAVASENKVCSQIGIDLLKAGGNAADAVRSCS